MESAPFWLLILIGCCAGTISGLIGIGGGVIIIPALRWRFCCAPGVQGG